MQNKNISIITNFGCSNNCWYCIWKGHPYENIQLETDWNKLEAFLYEYRNFGKVSVSGGGDCLYKYGEYEPWWDKLFNICKDLKIKIDVHSRERLFNPQFWKKINKVVVSSDTFGTDANYFSYLLNYTKLRICHVVTAESTEEDLANYIRYSNETGCQFTLKQLTKYDDNGNYLKFKQVFKHIYFLDSGNYNIYYFPDNTIKEVFI